MLDFLLIRNLFLPADMEWNWMKI